MPELMALLEDSARGPGRFVFLPSGDEVTFVDRWRRGEAVARHLNARRQPRSVAWPT